MNTLRIYTWHFSPRPRLRISFPEAALQGGTNVVPDPQAGPATMSDHDPSAPVEGTGARSDAHGTHAARATRTRRRH